MRMLAIALLAVCSSGCISAEVRQSILDLREDHKTYRQATVANPAYNEAEAAAVAELGEAISAHLTKLEELTR